MLVAGPDTGRRCRRWKLVDVATRESVRGDTAGTASSQSVGTRTSVSEFLTRCCGRRPKRAVRRSAAVAATATGRYGLLLACYGAPMRFYELGDNGEVTDMADHRVIDGEWIRRRSVRTARSRRWSLKRPMGRSRSVDRSLVRGYRGVRDPNRDGRTARELILSSRLSLLLTITARM